MKKTKTMNDGGMASSRGEGTSRRYTRKYEKLAKRFPGYKPTLESPVDTRGEYRTFKQGLKAYRKGLRGSDRPTTPSTPITPPTVPVIPPNAPPAAQPPVARKRWKEVISANFPGTMKKGGMVRGSGCAKRGKTRGRMI
jgi:hypothetical protein